jgi:hypothetical protein
MAPNGKSSKNKTMKAKAAAKRNTRRANKNNTKANVKSNGKRHSLSIAGIREKFSTMDKSMREFVKKNNLPNPHKLTEHVSRQWQGLFKKPLGADAAKGLSKLYSKGAKQAGGMAPLGYTMGPGMPGVMTYATFPTEAGADPKMSSHLDVYYNTGMAQSCGTENTTAQVPKDMGTNLVPTPAKGGGRRRRGTRLTRKRGGDFITALETRLYVPTNPSDSFQRVGEAWMGQPGSVYDNPRPEAHAWATVSNGQLPPNTDGISIIDNDITKLANPSPYPAVRA